MLLPPPVLLLLFLAQDHDSPVARLSAKEQKRVILSSRRKMCEAIVAEMHIEILKHDLKKDGEDDVYETVPVKSPQFAFRILNAIFLRYLRFVWASCKTTPSRPAMRGRCWSISPRTTRTTFEALDRAPERSTQSVVP